MLLEELRRPSPFPALESIEKIALRRRGSSGRSKLIITNDVTNDSMSG